MSLDSSDQVWDILDLCEATKGGWSTTTTSDLSTTECQSIMAMFLPVMSANNLHTPFQADRVEYDAAKERVAAAPESELIEAAEPIAPELSKFRKPSEMDSQVCYRYI